MKHFAYAQFPCLEQGPENVEIGALVLGARCVKIDSGIILFLAMHHYIVDGTRYRSFMKLWSEILRRVQALTTTLGVKVDELLRKTAIILGGLGKADEESV